MIFVHLLNHLQCQDYSEYQNQTGFLVECDTVGCDVFSKLHFICFCAVVACSSFVSFLCRHFLFKTGTGSTPFFGAAAPGYTMATGTVYSTPARPLPRNTLSRGAFKFKKSPKYCSWKCTALAAVGIAVVLSIILCYCIGKVSIGIFTVNKSLKKLF